MHKVSRVLSGLTAGAELRIDGWPRLSCLAVSITIALWPYPPLTDRTDPEYAERFEAAALLIDEAPAVGAFSNEG